MVDDEGELRKVHAIGTSRLISLPQSWAKKYGINKGDEVVVKSNDVLIISPKVDFKVEIEADVIWFIQGEKRAGLKKESVRKVLENYTINRTSKVIKNRLVNVKGFSPAIPIKKITEAVRSLTLEFEEAE